jgi:pimeloyl-ACP methyl ester carboxylesterase
MSPVFEKRELVVNGVRSPVRIAGQHAPPGEAVVFVHGNNAGADWEPLLSAVAEFACVVVPDMPGFGAADKPTNWAYTVPGYAEHLDGIVGQLGIERAHLVVHDFGGPWALAWVSGHLDMIGSMTLINTPAVIDHLAAKIWRTPVVAEVLWRVATARFMRRMVKRRDPGLPDAALDQIVAHAMDRGTQRAVLRLYRSTGKDAIGSYTDGLERFTGAVLIVWGRNDTYLPVAQADRQQRLFRHAELQLIPDAGHWPWLEQPEQVVGCVADFLRGQVAKAAV